MAAIVKPNLFVIGAPKAGTTSLCELLGSHPDLFMCRPKEPDYFSLGRVRGRTLEWYTGLFAEAGEHVVVAEGSTTYSVTGVYQGIAARIAAFSGDARIIYAVRNPFERMQSEWMQWRDMGILGKSFPDAVRQEPAMVEGCLYWKNLIAYREHFSDDRILVLFFEDLTVNMSTVVRRCFQFLGLDPSVDLPDPSRPRNVAAGKREDRLLLAALRSLPGYDSLRDRVVPVALRRALKGVVTRPIRERPMLDAETLAFAKSRIADDARRFLEYHGKPANYWSWPT